RDLAQLPFLRTRLHPSGRRRQSARGLRYVRRLWRFHDGASRHPGTSHCEDIPVFWLFVVVFNLVGAADLINDYYNATQLGLPAVAGELRSTYVIPMIYVPLLMITHVVSFDLLVRQRRTAHRAIAVNIAR